MPFNHYTKKPSFWPLKFSTSLRTIGGGAIKGAMGLALMVTGCGGGGGGGGGSASVPNILAPTPIPATAASELANTPSLSLVKATAIYSDDVSSAGGRGHRIAVLDSGVDAGHAELTGRVIGGGDWHNSNEDGRVDPNGHGTHVASIIAAARDSFGMHGVVPEAEIVSYRILNERGVFGGRSGNVMVPSILSDVGRRNLKVVNNSWASFYEINDFSASVIERSLSGELTAYRQTATSTGAMMVWAAGNDGDEQVSVRSGLPHYFPELKDNWLAVVAVDQNGHEPRYTNRCGLAAGWCLTAPGGGDDQPVDGVEAARTGGGYTRKSGTSMAAPVVSGALTLLMEAMPTISPRQAAARLKATTTYQGLQSAEGCTINTCSQQQMRDIFGHGLIQVEDALQPIGRASILTSSGEQSPAPTTYIKTPTLLGDSFERALEGSTAVVQDDFDQALFLTRLDVRVLPSDADYPDYMAEMTQARGYYDYNPQLEGSGVEGLGLVSSFASSAPIRHDDIAELVDIPTAKTEGWHGVKWSGQDFKGRMMIGHGTARHAVHLIIADDDSEQNRSWLGGGVDRTDGLLDGESSGGFGVRRSSSQWMFAGQRLAVGKARLTGEALMGMTTLTPAQGSLVSEGKAVYDAWSLKLGREAEIINWGAVDVELQVQQPPALRSGHMTIDQPVRLSDQGVAFAPRRYDLKLPARELRQSLRFATPILPQSSLKLAIHNVENAGHKEGHDDKAITLNFNQRF